MAASEWTDPAGVDGGGVSSEWRVAEEVCSVVAAM